MLNSNVHLIRTREQRQGDGLYGRAKKISSSLDQMQAVFPLDFRSDHSRPDQTASSMKSSLGPSLGAPCLGASRGLS